MQVQLRQLKPARDPNLSLLCGRQGHINRKALHVDLAFGERLVDDDPVLLLGQVHLTRLPLSLDCRQRISCISRLGNHLMARPVLNLRLRRWGLRGLHHELRLRQRRRVLAADG